MNATYRKNLKSIATACKNYTDEVADNLRWELGTYDLSIDTNSNTAHIKQLPSGTIQTTVAQVDGVGYKVNQMVANGNFSDGVSNWNINYTSSYSISNNILTFTSDNNILPLRSESIAINTQHKYLFTCKLLANSTDVGISLQNQLVHHRQYITTTNQFNTISFITSNWRDENLTVICVLDERSDKTSPIQITNVMLFDLTADFGSGNEPSTVSDCASAYLQRGINIYEYTPQQSSIKNNAFTGVKVEGVNKCSYPTFSGYTYNWYINSNFSSAVNPVKLLANKKYKITGNNVSANQTIHCRLFDINGNFITSGAVFEGMGFSSYQNAYSGYTGSTYTTVTNFNITVPQDCYIDIVTPAVTNNPCVQLYIDGNETYVPYIAPTTISVDLTTIKDSNNVSLFPSGKMMGNSNVADFITPTNQESRWNEAKLKDLVWGKNGVGNFTVLLSDFSARDLRFICNKYINSSTAINGYTTLVPNGEITNWGNTIYINDTNYNDATSFINHFTDDDVIQFERATYLTSNTDLTTLTKINAESNGTITLNNTDNVDMPNTIKSLKEVAK